MDILHQVSFHSNQEARKKLESLGIYFKTHITSFNIFESDEKWTEVKKIIDLYKGQDFRSFEFSHEEKLKSDWFSFSADAKGYPSHSYPDFLDKTYDLSDYCNSCGVGANQIKPFIIKKPEWGEKQNFFQLNWVYDEIFVKPEFYNEVFKTYNIGYWEVINRKGEILDNVVQLKVDDFVNLELSNHSFEECKHCKRIKYSPLIPEYIPNFKNYNKNLKNINILKSNEWFGYGGSASKLILVSKKIFIDIYNLEGKDIYFNPIKPANI